MSDQQMPQPTPEMMEDFKTNLENMQREMQATYSGLADKHMSGTSDDRLLTIEMTATYQLVNWGFDERALQGGMQEFKNRLSQAWLDLNGKIQGATQDETMKLLNNMPIPDEMKQMNKNMLPQAKQPLNIDHVDDEK